MPDPVGFVGNFNLNASSIFQSCNGAFTPVSAQWVQPPTGTDFFTYHWSLSLDTAGTLTIKYSGLSNTPPSGAWPTAASYSATDNATWVFGIPTGAYTITQRDSQSVTFVDSSGKTATGTEVGSGATNGVVPITKGPVSVNFRQVGPGVAKPGGVLHFDYQWDSSTGNLNDLKDCQIGENVTYSGGNPFIWQKPPYNGSTPNPTITWLSASAGPNPGHMQDNHSPKQFVQPYVANTFNASQDYRYQCPISGIVVFPGEKGITIARTVSDSTGRGCFGYTVTKSGASASVNPLPGVPKPDCVSSALVAENLGSKISGNEIGMSVSPPTVSVGLNEPIFVDLTVLNKTAQTVGVDLGLNAKSNLELTILNPAGDVMTQTSLSSAGIGLSGEVSLAPHGTFVEKLLLNEWYAFPLTGTYSIKMTLLNDDGIARADSPSTDFSVQIGPRNPTKLALISRELADKAITGATLGEKMEAAKTLSYIVDPAAVDSLVRVLQQGAMVAHYAVPGLARIGNPDSITALTAALDYADDEVRSAARHALGMLQGQAPGPSGPVE
jgi:PBS lyase HEAT-like repeat